MSVMSWFAGGVLVIVGLLFAVVAAVFFMLLWLTHQLCDSLARDAAEVDEANWQNERWRHGL